MDTATPRTDAFCIDNADLSDWGTGKSNLVYADQCRQLERELISSAERVKELEDDVETNYWQGMRRALMIAGFSEPQREELINAEKVRQALGSGK